MDTPDLAPAAAPARDAAGEIPQQRDTAPPNLTIPRARPCPGGHRCECHHEGL